MAIDHEAHKIRIKAVSDRMNHPMEYNDAGAPKMDAVQASKNGGYLAEHPRPGIAELKAKFKSKRDQLIANSKKK